MRPTASEQLSGLAGVLATSVAPSVDDAYVRDILDGTVATLEMLADVLDDVGPFLLWDIEQSQAVLAMVDVHLEEVDVPPFDLPALRARHDEVRAVLERSVDRIRSDAAADAAMVAHIRERSARYPFVGRHRGGSLARSPR